ncbi:MAG: flavodoxin domain-containing protein [Rhodospirillales bacterium]|nr:flavodoxin domain-containing protein [Rhodospirillales bacterium]
MNQRISILVATMTGTAELVADEIGEVLVARGVDLDIRPMDGLGADVFAPDRGYIICTSTYGHGDVPDNARALFASLERARPDLLGVCYGVFALGDMTYADTFCFGGRKFDDLLRSLGAIRIGERMEHDASSGTMPEDEAAEWAEQWFDQYAVTVANA